MKIIFETQRLIVKQWENKDYKDLFEYASDENVTKYLHFKTYENMDTAKQRIKSLIDNYQQHSNNNEYAIMLKEEKKVIGSINISGYKQQAGGTVRIGYALNYNYWGKGYATEVVVGLFKYIKNEKIAKRVEATHDVTNAKSGNVLKRAGMTFEGILRRAGENNFHNRYDVALYSILDEEIRTE